MKGALGRGSHCDDQSSQMSSRVRRLRGQAVLKKMAMLVAGWAGVVVVSCTAAGAPPPDLPASPTATAISLPAPETAFDRERNRVTIEAVKFATRGCPGTDLRLSGPPTRIQTASTSLSKAAGLVSPGTEFYSPPGGVGPGGAGPGVWIIAVEGPSASLTGASPPDGADTHSFVFVIDVAVPTIAGCVVRDVPMANHTEGGAEFEVLFDTR